MQVEAGKGALALVETAEPSPGGVPAAVWIPVSVADAAMLVYYVGQEVTVSIYGSEGGLRP